MTSANAPTEPYAATSLEQPEDPFLAAIFRALPGSGWQPLPHQIPPDGDWVTWLLCGGRGIGKTDASASYVNEHVKGPPCDTRLPGGHRIAIIGPTLGDAVDACLTGPSGLKAHNPAVTGPVSRAGGTYAYWPNGTEAKLFGTHKPEDVERLRAGGNRCLVWAEELAAWRKLAECWEHMEYGLRIGKHPRVVASSTPKPLKAFIAILQDPETAVTRATTADNPHLAEGVRSKLYKRYQGTRLGRQELLGELLTDIPGARWTYDMLAGTRVDAHPDLARVVVAVDPSGGSDAEADEQGITVQGRGVDQHAYVLADRSCRLTPDGWGRRAVQAFLDFKADCIVCERNYGGDMVLAVIKTAARAMGVLNVPVKMVTASRGKLLRAEPVAALYEQQVAHHVGEFPELEDQQTQWTPDSGQSPDRLDAVVMGLTDLMLERKPARMKSRYVA